MRRRSRPAGLLALAGLALVVVACAGQPAGSHTIQLMTLNDSGVTGSATFTDLGDGTTRVEVDVDPAGHPDMPAHIHPGTCADLVPQPRYPLPSILDGRAETIVPASLEELFAGELALNIHSSPEDYPTFAACGELD